METESKAIWINRYWRVDNRVRRRRTLLSILFHVGGGRAPKATRRPGLRPPLMHQPLGRLIVNDVRCALCSRLHGGSPCPSRSALGAEPVGSRRQDGHGFPPGVAALAARQAHGLCLGPRSVLLVGRKRHSRISGAAPLFVLRVATPLRALGPAWRHPPEYGLRNSCEAVFVLGNSA